MRCPSCGVEVDPAATFCPRCHSALVAPSQPADPWADAAQPQPWPTPTPDYWLAAPVTAEPAVEPVRSRGSRGAWLAAALGVLVIAAVIGGVNLGQRGGGDPPTGGPATGPASPTLDHLALDQARAVNSLLDSSNASRTRLGTALNAVDTCGDLAAAITTLEQVGVERAQQVERGRNLAVDRLVNGPQLRDVLVEALSHSLRADQHFVAWARAVEAAGCPERAPHDDAYQSGQDASALASASKRAFVQMWNPVATSYGLAIRQETDV